MSDNSHGIDFAVLPESSRQALLSRGLTHYLGSEVAAKVTAWKGKNEGASDDAIAAYKTEVYAEAKQALLDGTMGFNARGPRLDPVEAEMTRLATAEVKAILRGAKMTVGKDKNVRFADGTIKSLADMVATRIERESDRLRKEAERNVKAVAKKASEVAGGATAEALGL